MSTTMTAVQNILKEVYERKLQDQLQSKSITIRRIEKTSEGVIQDRVGGKYTTFPIRVARNHGIGARGEMEPLPPAETQKYLSARVNLKYHYGSTQLTGQTFELAKTNPQSFASTLDLEVNGMREGLSKDINRQVYGTNIGIIATSTALGTAGNFITTNPQYVEHEMILDLYNDSDVVQEARARVSDIVESSPGVWTVSFTQDDGSASTAVPATNWYFTRAGSRNKEKTGFDQILNISGNYTSLYNVTHSIWTANIDSTGGAISEGRMTTMVDNIRRRGGKTTVMFASLGVRTAYFNLLVMQRRYSNVKEFDGGFKGLGFATENGEIPIVTDFDTPPNRLYFIDEDDLKLYQAGDWSWMNRDGSMWKQVIDSNGAYDAYRATLYKYCELGIFRRNSYGVMTGITEA